MKAPDIEALNCALKVKQYINATKTNNQINKLQKEFTKNAVLISMEQMIYNQEECSNKFIITA